MATTSIGASGVTFPDGGVQSGATNGIPALNVYTSSGTWTKPATVKAIKVTVVGGGGNGGAANKPTNTPGTPTGQAGGGGGGGGASVRVYPAASLPGPQPYTVGGAGATSSFGAAPASVISATGGSTGTKAGPGVQVGYAGGSGSGGQVNITGGGGGWGQNVSAGAAISGNGGSSIFGGGAVSVYNINDQNGIAGGLYGGGGSGGVVVGTVIATAPGGAGGQGVVIVEEFY